MQSTIAKSSKVTRIFHNILIVGFVTLLSGLGVNSVLIDNSRYGYGTFSKQVVWDAMYYWVYDDGREEIHWPGDELRGEARKKIDSHYPKNTRYALGGMKSWVKAYLKYMYEHRKSDKVRSFKAVIYYRVNYDRRLGGIYGRQSKTKIYSEEYDEYRKEIEIHPSWTKIVLEYPEAQVGS